MPRIVLASASPSRRRLLRMVGIEPEVIVSGVDEEREEYQALSPRELVLALAIVKAHTVAASVQEGIKSGSMEPAEDVIIIGSDSTFEFEGRSLGKPGTPERAIERCKLVAGKSGTLHTGHCIISIRASALRSGGSSDPAGDPVDDQIDDQNGAIREHSDIASTKVHFAAMSDAEIEGYVATKEPLFVAGGFTLDGMSAPFIRAIEGDWSNVIGLSLPLVRNAITSLGYSWFEIATAPSEMEMGSK